MRVDASKLSLRITKARIPKGYNFVLPNKNSEKKIRRAIGEANQHPEQGRSEVSSEGAAPPEREAGSEEDHSSSGVSTALSGE